MGQPALWVLQLLLSDTFVLMCLMFAIIGLLEFVIPANKIPARHYRLNLGYAFANVVAITALTPPISAVTAYTVQNISTGLIDLHALGFGGVLGGSVAVVVSTFIFDFFAYWEHRFVHGSKVFWQEHLLHHSDEYMNVTTTSRQHLIELVLLPVFVTIPMAILFKLPVSDIAALSLIPTGWVYLTHANIRLGFGPFWWLLTSPNYHRIHHSLEARHIDKNFVGWFPIWDIVFGTAVLPRRDECPGTGVVGVSVQSVAEAYLLPFIRWRDMTRGTSSVRVPLNPTVTATPKVASRLDDA